MTLVLAHDATDHCLDIEARIAWLRTHDLNPNDIYRVEIHVIDVPLIRVFEFLRNADGKLYCPLDHDHRWLVGTACEVARRDPYDVLLKAEPPAGIGGPACASS